MVSRRPCFRGYRGYQLQEAYPELEGFEARGYINYISTRATLSGIKTVTIQISRAFAFKAMTS